MLQNGDVWMVILSKGFITSKAPEQLTDDAHDSSHCDENDFFTFMKSGNIETKGLDKNLHVKPQEKLILSSPFLK